MPISKRSSSSENIPDEDIDTSEIPELGASFFAGAILTGPGENLIDKVRSSRRNIPSVSVTYARNGASTKANALGMRPMQERAYEKRGEQYLLIKSPPASGKSRALMFVALDKLKNQGLKQAIIVVPERSIGASFHDEALSQSGCGADWKVNPRWNLCDAPGSDSNGKVDAVKKFVESEDKTMECN